MSRKKYNGYLLDMPLTSAKSSSSTFQSREEKKLNEDKRIGYTVRLFPSQLRGVIVRTRIDRKGIKKLIVRTTDNKEVEITDLPYLYEVLKRK